MARDVDRLIEYIRDEVDYIAPVHRQVIIDRLDQGEPTRAELDRARVKVYPPKVEPADFRAPGWDRRIDLGDGLFLLHWPAGSYAGPDEHWGFEHAHLYDMGKAARVTAPFTDPDTHLVAPVLDKHEVTDRGGDQVTVSPSVLCDCGTHGFIVDGVWRSV